MTRSGIEPTTSRSRGERSNHWATSAVIYIRKSNTLETFLLEYYVSQTICFISVCSFLPLRAFSGKSSHEAMLTSIHVLSWPAEWTSWFDSGCSVTCGQGTVMRFRQCSSGNPTDCPGSDQEDLPCALNSCTSRFVRLNSRSIYLIKLCLVGYLMLLLTMLLHLKYSEHYWNH